MFKKVISILQSEMRSRDSLVGDNTGTVSKETKIEQAGIVVELVLAVAILELKAAPVQQTTNASPKACEHKGYLPCPHCRVQWCIKCGAFIESGSKRTPSGVA